MRVSPGGRPARTEYRLLGIADGYSWLELRPRTGRTHQIRVHLAAIGCPVVGDPIYGRPQEDGLLPLMLHARAVVIPLYPRRAPIRVEAPPPEHMKPWLERMRPAGGIEGSARSEPPDAASGPG